MPTRDRSGLLVLGAVVLVLGATLSGWAVALAEEGSGPMAASGAALAALVGLGGLITWARSRERQRRMLSGLVDGLISTDPDGRILEVNQAFCELVGHSRAQLCGALPPYVFWPREEHVTWPEVWKAWTQATPRRLDAEWVHRDGHRITVELQIAVAHDRRGRAAQRVATARDVTDARRLQGALDEEREFSRAVLGALRDGWLVSEAGVITDVNDELCRITGFTREELLGHGQPYPFLPPEAHDVADRLRDRMRDSGGEDFEMVFQRKDGERFPVRCGSRIARTGDGAVLGFVTTVRDVSAERLREDGLRALAESDPLTGVANRRTFDELLSGMVSLGRRLSVVVLDLNDFKQVNDRFGHAEGDEALRRAARAWEAELRGGDVLARLGGDEFAVLLPDRDLARAERVGARLREVLPHPAGAAIGVAEWDRLEPVADLLDRADRGLYEDKAAVAVGRLADPRRLAAVDAAHASPVDFDELTASIGNLLGIPMSFVSLVGEHELRLAGQTGLGGIDGPVPVERTFCRHVVATGRPLVIEDADRDPLAPEDGDIRAYAGFPLTGADGETVGAMCAADSAPRHWSSDELAVLEVVARRAGLRLGDPAAAGDAAPSLKP